MRYGEHRRRRIGTRSRFIHSFSDETFEDVCPIDQRTLGHIAEGTAEHVDAAIRAALHAFPTWSALTAAERKPYLDRFAEEIGRRADAFCLLESTDAGVLLSRMRHGVVPLAMLNITWFSNHALTLQDRPIETEQARRLVRHDPAGVVAIVTPWNAPHWTPVHPRIFHESNVSRPEDVESDKGAMGGAD